MTCRSWETGGPRLRAVNPWFPANPSKDKSHQLLTVDERTRLATIASIVRFKKEEQIYSDGEPAKAIFNIISGVIKVYHSAPDGDEHISAFLYPEDLFGLTEEGRYVNSAKAVTPVSVYSLTFEALQRRLSKDADLQFRVITKLCHELRQAQRHALLLAQKRSLSKLAMFLQLQEHFQMTNGNSSEIYLPMDRSDIADYVSMSPAAVSRGFRSLEARGVIKYRDRRHVKIVDRKTLDAFASNFDRWKDDAPA